MRRRHHFEELDHEFHQHHRGPGGHGRHRARRGATTMAVLTLLAEQPMHGYELITALEERSGGRWKPSPGSIYPTLAKLEQRGLVSATEIDGKRTFELTEQGRVVATEMAKHDPAPWEQHDLGRHGELRRAIAELIGPARQIGRFGSAEQTAAAVAVIKDATAKLYRVLADGPGEADGEPTAG